ncbi:MAG: hypothetical protein JNM00_15575, partial [Flavobacteriales bacterium]|nr:hypothetical protein [Flavobacteriales bacterium]
TVTSMPEVAGDAALLVDPMSVEDITDAMVKVATDEGLCRALAKRGLERASDFSWDSTSEKLWESMQRAIADAG